MHFPVLQKEVIEYLNPKANENFIDCTIGRGGHALSIIERILSQGRLLGIDRDEEIIRQLKTKKQISKIKNNLILVCDNFINLKEIVERYNFKKVSGILYDLGVSRWHLKESGRGFSFLKDEPLDMRYDAKLKIKNKKLKILTAEKIVNEWSEDDLERILKGYGEERFSRQIARKIIEARKFQIIKTTFQLVEIIKNSTPLWYHCQRTHFATKTFQALRIAVNDELNNLENSLPQALEILEPKGRLVIISFHSLEDRIVKSFFREKFREEGIEILTKKPIIPTKEEIQFNPSARSAKLRAAIKLKN